MEGERGRKKEGAGGRGGGEMIHVSSEQNGARL